MKDKSSTHLTIKGQSYIIPLRVAELLDGKGIHYMGGGQTKSKDGGDIFYSTIETLKRSDPDFEDVFVSMWRTIFDGGVLKEGINWNGMNPSLPAPPKE